MAQHNDRSPVRKGFTLIVTLVMGVAFMVVALAISRSSIMNYTNVRRDYNGFNALMTAEAGLDAAMASLNANANYTGTSSTCPLPQNSSSVVELYNDSFKGRATYDTCIQNGTLPNEKIIYSRGRLYRPPGSSSPASTRTVRATVIASTIPNATYSVQTGPGGLTVTNSSQIANGAVYVGGKLLLDNTAQIGSPSNQVATQVANYACPNPATASFPSLCQSNDPITIRNQAKIYGSVQANGQINTNGMSLPGLSANSGVTAPSLPDYDRAAQKAAVTSQLTGAAASCSNSQKITWPANVKITGDVSLRNNCEVTVNGPVWITGSLSLNNRSLLRVANTMTSQPVIMVDGQAGLSLNNQSSIAANSNNIGLKVITFWANAPCSPDCENLTGTGLAESQNTTTITIGNQGLGAAAELYARWSQLRVDNGGTVGRLLGQTIYLGNTGSISFGLGTNNNPGTTVWNIQYYERI